jgi:hypothetical protein
MIHKKPRRVPEIPGIATRRRANTSSTSAEDKTNPRHAPPPPASETPDATPNAVARMRFKTEPGKNGLFC